MIMKKKFTLLNRILLILSVVLLFGQPIQAQFTAGDGGTLPTFTLFTIADGKIGGLYVSSSQRGNNSFSTGTRAVVDLSFPLPSTFEGDSYTLQFSTDNGSNWNNYQYDNADLSTTGDNFSLSFEADYMLRLFLNGGAKDGFTSNEVFAPLSSVDTRFSGWSLNEGMFITGIMVPWVGRGLEASFTVKKLSDESVITDYLSYQWYRVNPLSYEMNEISGATTLNFTTTDADVGYSLLIKATGDGTNVGGFSQVFSSSETIFSNKAFASNVTSSSFLLNLFKTTDNLSISDLKLYDINYDEVTISSVVQGTNAAIYTITATMDVAKSPYFLQNNSDFWRIVSVFDGYMMEGVNIDLGTGIDEIDENILQAYPIPTRDEIHFRTNNKITRAEIVNIRGMILLQSDINKNEGTMSTTDLSNGIYFLRLKTSNGIITKKIQVSK